MQLRYGRDPSEPTRRRLWEFARTNNLIGLDYTRHPNANLSWEDFPPSQKGLLSAWWRHQFDLFYSIQKNDCVVVLDGQTKLLGVGIAISPCEFRSEQTGFFRHVITVDWLQAFEWDKRLRLPLQLWFGGFRNTIQKIDKNSGYWRVADFVLRLDRDLPVSNPTSEIRETTRRKYGPEGEGQDHKKLKEWILNNPNDIGLGNPIDRHQEYVFPTGDRADLVFDLPENHFAVVEIETNHPDSIKVGAIQALKYKVLKCAEIGADISSDRVSAILVAWIDPEDSKFCEDYGIRFVRKKA